ncbi:MAG: hypothetical protein UW07_C0008G0011 [Candidatus Nomurabacteria bacterium GW2011_GWF2_43_8]|uniref:Uncharacterized protein n=3 Tax=Candidatus Nomuraibacteriota TaxID=1752729 RepID=A0A0G1INP5_9BACT|nr:MAG: hypothetical protein UV76_C0023G0012 [Candidatus Nomurabacteria bacterium GW2011_GWA2_43_15]KKT19372.1 MAG: hypothetical protein UW02_C0011G0023 [Candidatus Nomurabacteria bacterium GW2011_GWB1_43_7]KKT24789.1 MAG: hypothetical protein UW07_C0008G0011 [Candidatus Nomurabacteria bacterium GW2011_GWF2_43_8]
MLSLGIMKHMRNPFDERKIPEGKVLEGTERFKAEKRKESEDVDIMFKLATEIIDHICVINGIKIDSKSKASLEAGEYWKDWRNMDKDELIIAAQDYKSRWLQRPEFYYELANVLVQKAEEIKKSLKKKK